MLRLVCYFGLVLATWALLRHLPVLGPFLRVPLLGFFVAMALVGLLARYFGRALVARRRLQRALRELGALDTPHLRGKLGSLLVAERKHARAIPELLAAVEGEPQSAEWRYRLGLALLGAKRPAEAARAFEETLERNPEHAYGAALLRLAEARRASGEPAAALAALERYERAHGPVPESAHGRGLALRALGERERARASFREVSQLAARAPRYQRAAARRWIWRARLARLR